MKNVERGLNVVLVLAAVVMAGAMAHREFAQPSGSGADSPSPVFIGNWKQLLDSGRLASGHKLSPVQIIEFLDLECPACSQFQSGTLAKVKDAYGDSVALTVVHFPLPIHRFARLAAYASECAAAQGRFSEFVDLALARQDSFGILPWTELATRAGVVDEGAFASCLDQRKAPLVATGENLSEKMEISGTPTIVVNGLLYPRTPTEKNLRKDIEAVLNNKDRPFAPKAESSAPR